MAEQTQIDGVAWLEHMPDGRIRYAPSNDQDISVVILERNEQGRWKRFEREYGRLDPTFYPAHLSELDKIILGISSTEDEPRDSRNSANEINHDPNSDINPWHRNPNGFSCISDEIRFNGKPDY